MQRSRVLVIGLDGFELSLADSMIGEGLLPNIKGLREGSARWLLDHGTAKNSGLAWEHVSSGQSPQDSGRWSAVVFDPEAYSVRQEPTWSRPFVADLSAKAVVFDAPYFDLARAPNVRGIGNWGAHDPGVPEQSRPEELRNEIKERFGPYPAPEYIYGFLWPSPEKTRLAAEALVHALEVRGDASRWLLSERCPDWDLGIVVVCECHSSIEPMWHGVDPAHHLHELPSAPVAREGLRQIYIGIDRLVGKLTDAFPDATVVLFAMHGMGTNHSDIATMSLLPELLYRHAFGKPYMRDVAWPGHTRDGTPLLAGDLHWAQEMTKVVPQLGPGPVAGTEVPRQGLRGLIDRLLDKTQRPPIVVEPSNLDWMPAPRYRPYWSRMPAFAIPAFYDGRVRINLEGRESRGIVPLKRYRLVRDEVIRLARDCREVLDGQPVVDDVYFEDKDPYLVNPTQADLYILWRGAPVGFIHPTLGQIGPVPHFRTGGHTGKSGFLYVSGEGIRPGDVGTTSSFDVVPTVIDLLGEQRPAHITGKSLKSQLFPALATAENA